MVTGWLPEQTGAARLVARRSLAAEIGAENSVPEAESGQ
jgi:hypothetical protein